MNRAVKPSASIASFFVAFALLGVPDADARSRHGYADDARLSSEHIFVGQILSRTAIAREVREGVPVTLYEVKAYVETGLRESTELEADLAVVYVVAYTPVAERDAPTYDHSNASYPLYALPEAPGLMERYIFFARKFDSEAYVLADNSAGYLQPADATSVEDARHAIQYGYFQYR